MLMLRLGFAFAVDQHLPNEDLRAEEVRDIACSRHTLVRIRYSLDSDD